MESFSRPFKTHTSGSLGIGQNMSLVHTIAIAVSGKGKVGANKRGQSILFSVVFTPLPLATLAAIGSYLSSL
jgi:hypothetical protein